MTDLPGAHLEAILAAAYMILLVFIALGLELVAKFSHRRTQQFQTQGFVYHLHLNQWECPEGQQLPLAEIDFNRRLIRYRASPHICNSCRVKSLCTDSDQGRELIYQETWPHSEIARFHRGVALMLLLLAAFIAVVVLLQFHSDSDLLLLGGALIVVLIIGQKRLSAFLSRPSENLLGLSSSALAAREQEGPG